MYNKLLHLTKYTIAGIAGLLIFSGCTATSSPGPSAMQCNTKEFKVDANDVVTVSVSSNPDVAVTDNAKDRIAQKIKAEVNALKMRNPRCGKSNQYNLAVNLTNYDKGSAFARMMLAGLGQIHIEAETNVLLLPKKTEVAEFSLDKTFAWGGLYGGSTTIEDVEDGFAVGVAETVTKIKKEDK